MRGRLGSGILRRLSLDELVALDEEQYIDLAVKLGAEPRYRAKIHHAFVKPAQPPMPTSARWKRWGVNCSSSLV